MQVDPERVSSSHKPVFPVPERIPIFPLPNVVFFPRTYLPLHVFEPRYRAMVSDAAAGGQCVGMALLKEGWEEDYYGNPPIFATGCVGRLVSVQPLQDGRFNILLQGLARYEVGEQFFDKSYRQARVTLKPGEPDLALDPALRAGLLKLVDAYHATQEEETDWQGMLRQDSDDETLVYSLGSYLALTPLEKQLLMEADSLPQRARRLMDLIGFKLEERGGLKGWG